MMAEQFYTILTQIGKAKIANASALGQKINFTNFALGDGGGSYYNPIESQVGLKNEVWRGQIGNVVIDEDNPNWVVLENIIPSSIGGFMIREAGVFDDEGNLIAIGKYPETYKPVVENGSAKDLIIKMILEVSNTSAVTLKIDPTIILATKKDIDTLSNRIKKNENDIKELKQGSTIMEDLQTENKTLAGAINEALDKANQAFQSASDGKQVMATAITGKGVPTSSSDTFQKMATNIDAIETDKTGDATAVAGDILKNKTAYAKGNKLTGTLELTGNALLEHVLASNTFYNNDAKVKRTGTMPNRGAPAQILTTQGGQYNIPAGYFSGGSVKAQFANLVAGNIKSGVNIGGIVGSLVEKKYASGTTQTNGSGQVTVTGLGFNPNIIILVTNDFPSITQACTIVIKEFYPDIMFAASSSTNYIHNYGFGNSATGHTFYVVNGSFRLALDALNRNATWIAIE